MALNGFRTALQAPYYLIWMLCQIQHVLDIYKIQQGKCLLNLGYQARHQCFYTDLKPASRVTRKQATPKPRINTTYTPIFILTPNAAEDIYKMNIMYKLTTFAAPQDCSRALLGSHLIIGKEMNASKGLTAF